MPYLLQGLSIGFILSHLKVPFDENAWEIAQATIAHKEKLPGNESQRVLVIFIP